MLPSRKRSLVWLHFTEIEQGKCARCNICRSSYSVSNNSVGNLIRHLKLKHPFVLIQNEPDNNNANLGELQEIEQLESEINASSSNNRQASSSSSLVLLIFSKSLDHTLPTSTSITSRTNLSIQKTNIQNYFRSKRPVSITLAKSLHNQLLRFIVKGYRPFSIVEDKEFQKFIEMLCPGYSLPNRKLLVKSLLFQNYEECVKKVQQKLNLAVVACLTTDYWTSINNDSFGVVTAPFIIEGKLQSALLSCKKFTLRHTADNIQQFLKNLADEWKISQKISAVVTDNAANMTAAVLKYNWHHLSCFAHSINLIVQTAWQEPTIKNILIKIKGTVEYFKRSSHANAELQATQQRMNLPELKLKQDIITRWNSTLEMLKQFVTNKTALVSALAVLQSEHHNIHAREIILPSPDEWEIAAHLINIFQIFDDITREISAEKFLTASKILVFLKIIDKKLRILQEKFSCVQAIVDLLKRNSILVLKITKATFY